MMQIYSITWFDLYNDLDRYLAGDCDPIFISNNISFLKDNLEITVGELPLMYALSWRIKSPGAITNHMTEKYHRIPPGDLIAFIVFNHALLSKRGEMEISKIRYISLFTVFQYLLGQRISAETGKIDYKLMAGKIFDFDGYNTLYARIQGAKLPD